MGSIRSGVQPDQRDPAALTLTGHADALRIDIVPLRQMAHRNQRGLRPLIGRQHIREEVAGARLRITGGAFFQNNTAGAGALVELVTEPMSQ